MILTRDEQRMLDGEFGDVKAQALDFVIQFGNAFGAKRLVDISYVHYPAEMAIYRGSVEDAVEYAKKGGTVAVPTTTSTLACDISQWRDLGCPQAVFDLQRQVVAAHEVMGLICTYTCTPQLCGFVPPKNSYIVSVESSAIVYFNSVLGARTNRGGILTRYSAITGKYPLMGYLLDENRHGTHHIKLNFPHTLLKTESDYSALGFVVGTIVGSGVPVFDSLSFPSQNSLISLGAALATSGSVSLFHAPPYTAEAKTVADAFHGCIPQNTIEVTAQNIANAYAALTQIDKGEAIDFITLGCPHYNLAQIQKVAQWIEQRGAKVHPSVRFWVCTNRMTKNASIFEGYAEIIEDAGGKIVCDSCPVESHMRISTCREHGLPIPQVNAMVTDSAKMARYVRDLIGCKTAFVPFDRCMQSVVTGKLE